MTSSGPATDHDDLATGRAARLRRNTIIAVAIGLTIFGLTDVRWRARLDPERPKSHRTDFTCFTEAAAAFFDGRDPYQVTNARGWGYPYPPLLALMVAPLAPLDEELQGVAWFFISLLFCFGCYVEGRRLVRCLPRDLLSLSGRGQREGMASHDHARSMQSAFPTWIGWLALLTVSLPVLNCLQRGQVGILKIYFLMLGLRLIVEQRSWVRSILGGMALALPIVVKITPVLPVGVFLFGQWAYCVFHWRGDRRMPQTAGATLGVCLGLILFLLLVPAAVLGWNANLKHLDTWYHEVATRVNDLNDADRTGNTRTARNQSLSNAVYRAGNWIAYQVGAGEDDRLADKRDRQPGTLPMDAAAVDKTLFVIRLSLALLLLAAAASRAWHDDELGQWAVFGLATAATLIVAPIGRAHYYMLLLPALLFVPPWLLRHGKPRAAMISAVAPLVLCVSHYAALDFTGRIGALGIGTTIWYVAALVPLVVWRRRSATQVYEHETGVATRRAA